MNRIGALLLAAVFSAVTSVMVTKDGDLIGYLHQYLCRERWEETHAEYAYSLPKS